MLRLFFFLTGIAFGAVLILSGVSNYNVIRDMFLLRSIHLYGVLGVAVTTAFLFTQWYKRFAPKGLITGHSINFDVETVSRRHVYGGLIAGAGWALTGACPGPALALIGFGTLSGIFITAGIFLGTYVYGQWVGK